MLKEVQLCLHSDDAPRKDYFPQLALKAEGGPLHLTRERERERDSSQRPLCVCQGRISECWVDRGEVAVLLGGPENFQRGVILETAGETALHEPVWICKAPPSPFFIYRIPRAERYFNILELRSIY